MPDMQRARGLTRGCGACGACWCPRWRRRRCRRRPRSAAAWCSARASSRPTASDSLHSARITHDTVVIAQPQGGHPCSSVLLPPHVQQYSLQAHAFYFLPEGTLITCSSVHQRIGRAGMLGHTCCIGVILIVLGGLALGHALRLPVGALIRLGSQRRAPCASLHVHRFLHSRHQRSGDTPELMRFQSLL